MPQPRRHGGAELLHIPLVVPGFKGLNKQQAGSTLGPEWATVLLNAAIDDSGRVAARKGWGAVTTSALGSAIVQAIEYIKSDATTALIVSTATTLHSSVNDGASFSDITGTASFTDGNWQFHNFNNQIIGVQAGKAPIRYTGTGSFAHLTDVNAPKGGVSLSAFGRMWISGADGHTLYYSALLDATDWTSSDSGTLDLWNVWPGNDQITALASFNGTLIVFGKNSIVFYTDGAGSALGFDPIQAYVSDVVRGTGCIARDSIQEVDGDLWFLSENGLQSLGRLVTQKSNPLDNLSKPVQDFLSAYVSAADLTLLRSAYSPRDRVFLLSLPSVGTTESGVAFGFDTRGRLEDGSARCIGTWTLVPTAMIVRRNGKFLMARKGSVGKLGQYITGLDDASSYSFEYNSGWIDLTQQGLLLMPKRYEGVFFSDSTIDVNFKWAFDFSSSFLSKTKAFTGTASGGEWGADEWGEAEFGGGVLLREGQVPARGTGQYIQLGISAIISNTTLAVQKLTLFAKVGRLS
jgi:hypothetical protein